MAKFCTKCGKALAQTAKFCAACGAKTANAEPQIKKPLCAYCGSELKDGAAFCTACGAQVNGTPAAPRQAAQAAQPKAAGNTAPRRSAAKKAPPKRKLLIPVTAAVLVLAAAMALFLWPGLLKGSGVKFKDGYQVVVPEGALDDQAKVTVETPDHDDLPCEEELEILHAVSLTAENGQTELNRDVTVRFELPKNMKKEDYIGCFCGYYDGEKWEYILPEGYHFDEGYVEFGTPHFSKFCLFKPTPRAVDKAIELYAKEMAHQDFAYEYKAEELKPLITELLDKAGLNNKEIQGIIAQNAFKEFVDGKAGAIGSLCIGYQNDDPADMAGTIAGAIGDAILDKQANDMDFANKVLGNGTTASVAAIMKLREGGSYADAYKEFVWAAMDALPPAKYAKIAIDINKVLIRQYNDYTMESLYQVYVKNLNQEGVMYDAEWNAVVTTNAYAREVLEERQKLYKQKMGLSDQEFKDIEADVNKQIWDELRHEMEYKHAYRKNENQIAEKAENYEDIIKSYYRNRGLLDLNDEKYFSEEFDLAYRIRYLMKIRNMVIRLAGDNLEDIFGYDENMREAAIAEAVKVYLENRKDKSKFYKYLEELGCLKKKDGTNSAYRNGYWKLLETHENWDPNTKSVYETHYYRDQVSGGGGSYTVVNEVIGSNGCSEGHESHDCHGEAMTSVFTYTVPKDRYAGGESVHMDLNASATTNGIVCYYFGAYMNAQISSNKPGQRGFTFGGWDLTDANGDYGVETDMVGEYADHSTRKPVGSSRSVSGKMPDGSGAKAGDRAYITVTISGSAGAMVVYEYVWTVKK